MQLIDANVQKKVMLVAPSDNIVATLRNLAQFKVRIAHTIEDAAEQAKSFLPSIIVLSAHLKAPDRSLPFSPTHLSLLLRLLFRRLAALTIAKDLSPQICVVSTNASCWHGF